MVFMPIVRVKMPNALIVNSRYVSPLIATFAAPGSGITGLHGYGEKDIVKSVRLQLAGQTWRTG